MSEEFTTETSYSEVPTDDQWTTLLRLSKYLWPADRPDLRLRVVLSVIFLLLSQVVNLTVPYFFKLSVDALTKPPGLIELPAFLILAYGTTRVLRHALAQLRDVIFVHVSQHAQRIIGLHTFQHLHELSLQFHLSRRTGGLARVIERGIHGIHFVLSSTLFHLLPTLLEIFLVSGFLWWYSGWQYAAICISTVTAYIGFTAYITNYRLRLQRERNRNDSEASSRSIDSLINYETVKYFNNEKLESNRYDSALRAYEKSVIKSESYLGILNAGQGLIIGIGLVLIMWISGKQVVAGTGTVGDFVMVNTYLIQLYVPLNFLGWVYREMRQGLTDMEKLFALTAISPQVTDSPNAKPLILKEGAIHFKNITFGYLPERTILHNLSFSVPAGKKVAVVGATGSGKSTLTRLLYRFYNPSSGTITVDGQDITKITQQSLRKAIGIVPQDTVLFNETIAYNIGYGRPDASQEEIRAAAKAAQIDQLIESLPQGYNTMVGERGLKLSGGEKQRIAIARAILKQPKIMIFDEATSALDSHTEKEIQAALNTAAKDRPTLVIAHRLTTIIDADEIIVLQKGRIVERGSHKDLLLKKGEYSRMWEKQQESQS
jgi:ATP-binding cassette subfamily B protein